MNQQLLLAQFSRLLWAKNKVALQQILEKLDVTYRIPHNSLVHSSGETCLHIAAKGLDLETVKDLITRGANLIKPDSDHGYSPLHLAARQISILQYKRDTTGKLNREPMIDFLLSEQIKSANPLNCKDKDGVSHLHIACMFNHTEAVNFLIDGMSDTVQSDNYGNYLPGYTALHFAVRYSSVESVNILLEHNANIHAKDKGGMSPVHLLINRLMLASDFINIGKQECIISYQREIKSIESMVSLILQSTKLSEANFVDDTGLSVLHLASCLKDSSIVQDYFEKEFEKHVQVNENSTSWPGWTPLHFAACLSPENFKLLLSKGADIDAKNTKGESPLDMLKARYPPDIIYSVLSTKEDFKNTFFTDKSTNLLDTIHLMADCNKFHNFLQSVPDVNSSCHEAMEKLIEKGADVNLVFDIPKSKLRCNPNYNLSEWADFYGFAGETPLKIAVKSNCVDAVRVLLRHNADIYGSNSPIHSVMHDFNHDIVEHFIRKFKRNRCEVGPIDSTNVTALHFACATFDLKWAKKLLDFGADINARILANNFHNGSTPLHLLIAQASAFGSNVAGVEKLLKFLLQRGADVTIQTEYKQTPLNAAYANYYYGISGNENKEDEENAENEETDQMKFLLKSADLVMKNQKSYAVNPADGEGFTHFHYACLRNNVEIVNKFLDNGINVNLHADYFSCNTNGFTPLHYACENKAVDVAYVLVKRGADVKSEDAEGNTPFHVALNEGFVDEDFVDFMFKNGVDINAKNIYGTSVLELLKTNNFTAQQLEAKGWMKK